MKMISIKIKSDYELQLENRKLHLVKDNDVRRVFEENLHELFSLKNPGIETVDELMEDMRELIAYYNEKELKKEKHVELENKYTYLLIDEKENKYVFGGVSEDTRFDIEVEAVQERKTKNRTVLTVIA